MPPSVPASTSTCSCGCTTFPFHSQYTFQRHSALFDLLYLANSSSTAATLHLAITFQSFCHLHFEEQRYENVIGTKPVIRGTRSRSRGLDVSKAAWSKCRHQCGWIQCFSYWLRNVEFAECGVAALVADSPRRVKTRWNEEGMMIWRW